MTHFCSDGAAAGEAHWQRHAYGHCLPPARPADRDQGRAYQVLDQAACRPTSPLADTERVAARVADRCVVAASCLVLTCLVYHLPDFAVLSWIRCQYLYIMYSATDAARIPFVPNLFLCSLFTVLCGTYLTNMLSVGVDVQLVSTQSPFVHSKTKR